jgi:hypothetical protein
MKKLLLILSVVILSACGETPDYVEGGSTKSGNQMDLDINYFKDSRTGLCYSERGVIDSYSHTCVPCTEEVEKLIK